HRGRSRTRPCPKTRGRKPGSSARSRPRRCCSGTASPIWRRWRRWARPARGFSSGKPSRVTMPAVAVFRFNRAALLLASAFLSARGFGQTPPFQNKSFPPDIVDASVDVVKIAANRYTIEIENPHVRVLRGRIPALGRVTIHRHRAGLLVAVTEV